MRTASAKRNISGASWHFGDVNRANRADDLCARFESGQCEQPFAPQFCQSATLCWSSRYQTANRNTITPMSCSADRTTNSNRAEQAATVMSEAETSVSPLSDMNRSVGPALAAGPRFARQMVRRQAPRHARGLEPVETAATLRPTLKKRRWRCSHGRQRVGPELALRSLALAATPWVGFLPSRAKPRIAYMAPRIGMSSPGVRGLVSVAKCS